MNAKRLANQKEFPTTLSDSISDQMRRRFEDDGYVAFNGVLTEVEVEKARRLFSDLVVRAREQRRDYVMGVEPTRSKDHTILSRTRMPIPPPRHCFS